MAGVDEAGRLTALPQLVDGYVPDLARLPGFVLSLARDVDWAEEKPCFRTLAEVHTRDALCIVWHKRIRVCSRVCYVLCHVGFIADRALRSSAFVPWRRVCCRVSSVVCIVLFLVACYICACMKLHATLP